MTVNLEKSYGRLSQGAIKALGRLPSAELVSVWDEISTLACGDNNNNNFSSPAENLTLAGKVARLPDEALNSILKAYNLK